MRLSGTSFERQLKCCDESNVKGGRTSAAHVKAETRNARAIRRFAHKLLTLTVRAPVTTRTCALSSCVMRHGWAEPLKAGTERVKGLCLLAAQIVCKNIGSQSTE